MDFRYKETNDYVLKNISLKVNAGEYVALVGASGVGKTALCSLIPRFYDVNSGRILLDDNDIRRVRLDSLRRNIGIVQQDVYLFAGTIADNIRYGKRDASEEEIVSAAKRAMLTTLSRHCPTATQTDIGQRGEVVGRPKAAAEHCPCLPQRPADSDLRRSNQFARQRK